MQRVVRSTFVGLLTLAGLTACGDKVTVPPATSPTPGTVVHSVTVTPGTATLQQGDKITLAVSVDADAGVTDRTVTWSTGNSAIANVDQAGVVTAGTTAGTTTVTATSKADPSVKGAALITVGGGGTNVLPTISISTINQTVCVVGGACTSVPANLGSVAGQIDVTVNLDPGSQKVSAVQLIMNCAGAGNSATDTIVTQQTLTTSILAAEASSAPVTLSFNTGSFNATTGVVAFRNGTCTMKAKAIASNGTTTSTAQNITLANTDVVIGTLVASNNKINPVTGQVWSGGTVTVTATPILYTPNRAVRAVTLNFAGKAGQLQGSTTSGTLSGQLTASFVDGNGATVAAPATDIDGITNPAAQATFAALDTLGAAIVNTTGTCGANVICSQNTVLAGAPANVATIRLDTEKPLAGTLSINPNALQQTVTSWVGTNFRFVADSAAGFVGPNANSAIGGGACLGANATNNPVTCNLDARTGTAGVDSVTVKFGFGAGAAASSFTIFSNTTGLAETVANNTNTAVQITTDLLGNTDTSYVNAAAFVGGNAPAASRFGVDKTAPGVTMSGTADLSTSQTVGGTGFINATVTDALSGPAASQLVAQVLQNANITSGNLPSTGTVPNNTIFTNTGAAGTQTAAGANAIATGCLIGRFNRASASANADPAAINIVNAAGTIIGSCSPTPFNLQLGTTVVANSSGVAGYATTIIIPIDQAGNRAATQTIHVVEDATNPGVGALDLPTSISGGSSPVIPAAVTDNLDVTSAAVQLSYNSLATPLQYPSVTGPGTAFDNTLIPGSTTTAATATPSITFFARNIVSGAAAPPAPNQGAHGPGNIQVGALDETGRSGVSALVPLTTTTTVAQPSTTPWSANFTGSTTIAASTTTVSNCPTAGCTGGAAPANATSTTLTVTAQGATSVFANPFTTVQIWYQPGGAGPWFLAGTTGAGSSRDTGVGGSRFWDYTFVFDPPVSATNYANGTVNNLTVNGSTINVMGIGLDASGDGIFTAPITINITNP